MRTELFDYELPEALIAQRPPDARDGGRLLVVRAGGVSHASVRDFADCVEPGSLVVVNESRVLRARLLGMRFPSGGHVEIFLLRCLDGHDSERTRWRALGRSNRPLRPGATLCFDGMRGEVIARHEDGILDVELSAPGGVMKRIAEVGRVPLPPYVRREDDALDAERYQTVFARQEGSVAAPTAGLHLTREMIRRLEERGVCIGAVTLHVGLGTFRPVVADDLDAHEMHDEYFEVSPELASRIDAARGRRAPVVAIGTTVVRALESARDPERPDRVRPAAGFTRVFIQPGYDFGPVDALLTNFHMPRSTLLALVSAFAGRERVLEAYREAVRERYRFLSYGDAMWIPERLA
jgi:S-adenosylmethionine:tRNA ribosyltransferase-isomerase